MDTVASLENERHTSWETPRILCSAPGQLLEFRAISKARQYKAQVGLVKFGGSGVPLGLFFFWSSVSDFSGLVDCAVIFELASTLMPSSAFVKARRPKSS